MNKLRWQVIYGSHHTRDRHVSFLLAQTGVRKHNKEFCKLCLLFIYSYKFYLGQWCVWWTIIVSLPPPNLNGTLGLANTFGSNFKSWFEINQKLQCICFLYRAIQKEGSQNRECVASCKPSYRVRIGFTGHCTRFCPIPRFPFCTTWYKINPTKHTVIFDLFQSTKLFYFDIFRKPCNLWCIFISKTNNATFPPAMPLCFLHAPDPRNTPCYSVLPK